MASAARADGRVRSARWLPAVAALACATACAACGLLAPTPLAPLAPTAAAPAVQPTSARRQSLAPRPTAAPQPAPTPVTPTDEAVSSAFQQTFQSILGSDASHFGVAFEDLGRHQQLGLDDQRVFPSASVYKLAVATQALRLVDAGEWQLTDPLDVLPEDTVEPEPEGGLDPGETVTLEDALRAMLSVSSNAAGHAVLRLLGRSAYNTSVSQWGLRNTSVPLDDTSDEVAVTTAGDMSLLLREIEDGQLLSAASRTKLYDLAAIGGEPRPVAESLPDGTQIAEKAGNLDTASNVVAVVHANGQTFSLVVLDDDMDPGDARLIIGRLARTAYVAVTGLSLPADD